MELFTISFSFSLSIIIFSAYITQSYPFPEPPELGRGRQRPEESIELTPPLPTADLPPPLPACTLTPLRHTFKARAATAGGRPAITVPYSPPSRCPPPWSHAIVNLYGAVSGYPRDGIASVWLAGAEILRTSTPESFNSGTFWNIRKDITRYSYLLQQSNIFLSMEIENLSDGRFTGVYDVNLTILFYKEDKDKVVSENCWESKLGIGGLGDVGGYEEPAHLVIPVVAEGSSNGGPWLRIEDASHLTSKSIVIPRNAFRIVLEMYVTFHGDDEFWYSNPPSNYFIGNNLTSRGGNGPFREVYVRIDGNYVASDVPFPTVFPGGINPLLWKPVVAIGAFHMPTYDFDLTPFVGSLSDGKAHKFELGVSHAIKYWLIGANLHVWVEKESTTVKAGLSLYEPSEFLSTRQYNFKQLDGLFNLNIQRYNKVAGWVSVSCGNLTMTIARRITYRNLIEFQNNGAIKMVTQQVKVRTNVKVLSDMGELVADRKHKRKFPLSLMTTVEPGPDNNTSLVTTNITMALKQKFFNGMVFSTVRNRLDSGGWMLMKNQKMHSGKADTVQTLSFRGSSGCFLRTIGATSGKILRDNATTICPNILRKPMNRLPNTDSSF